MYEDSALQAGCARKLPDTKEMTEFLVASTMAGIAFGNASIGAVHALSYPVGAICHVPHGKAKWHVVKHQPAAVSEYPSAAIRS